MSYDDFTRAARAEAEDRHPPTHRNVPMYCLADVREREAAAFEAVAAELVDPSGPLRPLTTDERSYRYAQDLGYELPEEPR